MRRRALDVALGVLAFLFAAPSIAFPIGRDQGLYAYVARAWVHHGLVPYRDVLDHKTPGIYLLHAAAVLLFGDVAWGFRVFDLAAALAAGLLAARLASPDHAPVPRGHYGLGCILVVVFFFGFLNWWDCSQSEIHYGTLGLAATLAARRGAPRAAGALAGAAFVMKPPAVWLGLVALGLLARGGGRAAGRRIAVFVVAGAVPVLGVLGVFAACGALGAMFDIVVGANRYYVAHEHSVDSPIEALTRVRDYVGTCEPFTMIGALGLALGLRAGERRVRRRYAFAGALCLAALVAVAQQGKYYLLHWGVMAPAAAVLWCCFARDLALRPAAAAALVVLLYLGAPVVPERWYLTTKNVVLHVAGLRDRDTFLAPFAFPDIDYSSATAERIGRWLRARARPEDRVAVRCFEPEIYLAAGMRHEGRFFWTTFLTNPGRAYRRAEWLAEDRRDLDVHRPRFAVVDVRRADGPDSAAYFPGYVERFRDGLLAVVERP